VITGILFGHLMTPGEHQTTADIQRSASGKCEVIASISNQPKQQSENQRVRGSSSWQCTVATNQAIVCSFCYPIGRSNLSETRQKLFRFAHRFATKYVTRCRRQALARTGRSTLGAHVLQGPAVGEAVRGHPLSGLLKLTGFG
jgi:hypothetical protein